VLCDLCSKKIVKTDSVYHCPNGKTPAHDQGYDLCGDCASNEIDDTKMQMETEGNDGSTLYIPSGYKSEQNNPPCICGRELHQMAAKEAYDTKRESIVICDLCGDKMSGTEPVFHCLVTASVRHKGGYDLCFECGWKYIESQLDKQAMTISLDNEQDADLFAPGTAAHSELIQTEALVPLCICGRDLTKMDSTVYGAESTVLCDNCNAECTGSDIVWHCVRGKDAEEHDYGFDLCDRCARKQNKRVRTNWLSDLWQDVVVVIARFVVRKRPSSMMWLQSINKHWYRSLDPNKPNVNAIWEHNICRPMFSRIPSALRVRRWDRFYQYRYGVILEHRRSRRDRTKINADRVYSKFKVIENCSFDVEAINAMHHDAVVIDESGGLDDDEKAEFEGYFESEIGSHGLPPGFKWKLKCPVMALKLEQRGSGKYYCGVCKKNVFTVRNEEEMARRVAEGQCVQFNTRQHSGAQIRGGMGFRYDPVTGNRVRRR